MRQLDRLENRSDRLRYNRCLCLCFVAPRALTEKSGEYFVLLHVFSCRGLQLNTHLIKLSTDLHFATDVVTLLKQFVFFSLLEQSDVVI